MFWITYVAIASALTHSPASPDHIQPLAAPPSSSLVVVVEAAPAISHALVKRSLEEARSIWATAGVSITWRFVEPSRPEEAFAIKVVLSDEPGAWHDSALPVGWIAFDGAGAPEHTIHLSHDNASRLLNSTSVYHDVPAVGQDVLLGRALGRALAHEMGHYLLRSKAHAQVGLMRRQLSLDDLFSESSASLWLDGCQRALIAEQWPESVRPVDPCRPSRQ